MWHDREECRALWRAGARIFVCGDGRVGEGVREALIRSYVEKGMGSAEEARTWFDGIRNERFASDVFA
jgi:cytochrome P450/NADPH-cytochrome P450 reductase